MKKTSFFLFLILSFLLTANASYVKRGITTSVRPSALLNYTLTFDSNGDPIAAGSMYYSSYSQNVNSIVIIHANTNLAQVFPISLGTEASP
jgi:hypothetical protein